ncbi:MAG: universal stress protein [Acidimicrobiales bacterium]
MTGSLFGSLYDTVVMPVDNSKFSWHVVEHGRRLAEDIGAKVQLFFASSGEQVEPEMHDAAAAAHVGLEVTRSANSAEARGAAIAAYAARTPRSVIAMATHGHGGWATTVLGSTTAELLIAADRPVVLYGPEAKAPAPVKRVVACLDGSSFAESILEEAAKWAWAVGVPLWLVSVLGSGWGKSAGDVTEEAYLGRLARDLERPGLDLQWDALHGWDTGIALVEYANEEPGTLLAMSTHGRTGLRQVALGSVAADVVREARGPVLVQRPRE